MSSNLSEEEIIEEIKYNILNDPFIAFSQDASFESNQIRVNAIQGLLDLYNKEKEKNKEAITMLKEHIQHCEQEAKGSLNNEKCHIALRFDKHLLDILKGE